MIMAVFRQKNNYFTDFEDTGLFSGGSVVADVFADIVPELTPMTTAAVTAQQQAQATLAPTPVAPAVETPQTTIQNLISSGTFEKNPDQAVLIGDTYYQPIFNNQGSGESFQQGPLQDVITYKADENKVGGDVNWYNPSGELQQTTQQQKVASFTGGIAEMLNDPVIQSALLAGGAGGALGSALGLTGSTAQAVGTGLLKGGSAVAGGETLSDAITSGLLAGGLAYGGGLLSDTGAAQAAADADIAGGLIPEYGTNAAYDQFISSAMTPEASAAIAEMIAPPVVPEPVPTITEAPTVAAAPVDNIPEMVITPEPTIVSQPVTASDLGIDYSLSNGTVMTPLTDMGGVQGIQPGTSANLDVMGGGQGLTINVGAPSTTLADALATFGGVNPAYMADMGGAQGLTYQTPTGLVTETAIIPTANILSVLGETGINTATNIGSGIGTELANLNTGVEQAITAPTTPVTPEVTPAEKNLLSDLTPSQIASLLKGAMGLFGALGASKLAGGGNTSAPSVGALPTQGIPLNSQDYFNAIQQNYNTLLPAMPKDVATPLAAWYNSQYTGA